MTGKEALEEIKYCRAYINELGCEVPLSKIREYKIILKELDELAKYKRAFEILKELIVVDKLEGIEKEIIGYEYSVNARPIDKELTKEEYELLEELMNNE